MRSLMTAGLLTALVATTFAADKPEAEAPKGDWSEKFDKKFADIDLWDRKPTKEEATAKDTPLQTVDKDDQADDAKDDSLANVPAENKKSSSVTIPNSLPAELVDLVWKKIDVDRNGSATDREVAAAVKRLRIAINSKKSFPLRDLARSSLGMADDAILSLDETVVLIARVRGVKCPTAARAKQYFSELDQNSSDTVDSAEIVKSLSKLGAMGRYLAGVLAPTLRYIDLDDDHAIDLDEAYYSANILLRLQLVSQGDGLANRNPIDWLQIISAVATLDLDADNTVSRAESSRVRSLAVDFNRIDRNRDQQLSASELSDYQQYLQRVAGEAREAAYREQQERMRSIMALGRGGRSVGRSGKNGSRGGTSRSRKKGCLT